MFIANLWNFLLSNEFSQTIFWLSYSLQRFCSLKLGMPSLHKTNSIFMILLSKLLAWKFLVETMHTRLTSVKRFANLKVNLTVEQVQTCNLFLHIHYKASISALHLFGVWGTPMNPYWCIKPIQFKINDIDPERRFVNLFGEFSSLCAAAAWLHFTSVCYLFGFCQHSIHRQIIR